MDSSKQEISRRQIRSVTNLAIAINIGLCAVKVIVGFIGNSMSLISDGIHSLSDMTTDLMILVGVRLGAKEPDQKHPYGHGRLETLATGVIAIALLVVGAGTIFYAVADIAKGHIKTPHLPVLIVAILAIIAKESLSRVTRRVAIKTHSAALYANAWEQRSDAFSSLAVIIGYILMKFGFHYGDQIATVVVGTMITLVGLKVIGGCIDELTESAVDQDTIRHVESIINANPSIRQWHNLRTRLVGREMFLDVHILVDPNLDVAAAHEVSEWLENALQAEITRPVNVVVHIEPDLPAERLAGQPALRK
ncbi:MAG: cation diffusion facilitator family transporter [Planctomycetota bacterium]|nr:cation diffusion facilitator family transporter [Planctomycetota bacterium]